MSYVICFVRVVRRRRNALTDRLDLSRSLDSQRERKTESAWPACRCENKCPRNSLRRRELEPAPRLPPAPAAPLLAIAVLPVRHILLLVSLSSHDLPFLVITSGARPCFSSWLPARHALRQARQEVPRHRPARLNPPVDQSLCVRVLRRGPPPRLILRAAPPAPRAVSLRRPSRSGVTAGSAWPLCPRIRATGYVCRRRDNCSGSPHHRACRSCFVENGFERREDVLRLTAKVGRKPSLGVSPDDAGDDDLVADPDCRRILVSFGGRLKRGGWLRLW